MWFWFFSFVAFSKSYPCNISIITQVGFQANIFFLKLTIIFIQKDSYLEVSYIFAKVIPFSKSLLFSRVLLHPTVSIFKCFIQKTRKHTSIIFLYYPTNRRKSRFLWKQTNGFNIPLNFDFILHSESMQWVFKVG